MILCPNCQAENRSGAKFCRNCAALLPQHPIDETVLEVEASQPKSRATIRLSAPLNPGNPMRTNTKPLPPSPVFVRRPDGAIFGDAFLSSSLIFDDDNQKVYLVSQLQVPDEMRIQVCPNSECGAYFPPRPEGPEKFCTDCGTPLYTGLQDLMLVEKPTPSSPNLVQIVERGLSHGSVRAPLAIFEEYLAGMTRYCQVMPQVEALEGKPEAEKVIRWGMQLARGLDYLHDNGVSFEGKLDASRLGLVGDRAVWANFAGSTVHPEGYVTERSADVRALAALIYYLLTNKQQYEYDANLSPVLNQIFEQAFSEPGFANGKILEAAFKGTLERVEAPKMVDYEVGRRTDVGMVRTLNEDSILTIEVNRIQQSVSQPLGLFLVADGMGGHAAGEIASGAIVNAIAMQTMTELLPGQMAHGSNHDRSEWLMKAVEEANKKVFEMRKAAGTDMGSTLVSVVLEGDKAYLTHVGDRRAYLVNAEEIKQLTTDHSLVERLIATHQITREEARHHPQRNVIYRTVGDKAKVELEISTLTLKIGDYILLCSDGMSGYVEDRAIHRIILEAPSPQAACDALIDAANAGGGDDNISAVLVKIVQA
jgi:serine/threonine protein phosphatase PrpC